MMTFIISGGQIELPFLKEVLDEAHDKRVIAVDKGLESCLALEVCPDYIIGDFDSVSAEGEAFLQKQEDITFRLNPIKDDTDTEAALHLAFEKTVGDIVILGGTGTRLDHVMGNISILGQGLSRGRKIVLLDAYNRMQLVDKELFIEKNQQFGDFVSIFPYGGVAEGVTLKGFYYPLDNATLQVDSSLGISNEIVDKVGEITVSKGRLLVVESRDKK